MGVFDQVLGAVRIEPREAQIDMATSTSCRGGTSSRDVFSSKWFTSKEFEARHTFETGLELEFLCWEISKIREPGHMIIFRQESHLDRSWCRVLASTNANEKSFMMLQMISIP